MPRNLCMKYYICSFVVICIDQISKLLIRANMNVGQSISVIGDFFNITYVRNSGAAFSVLSGMRAFLIIIPLIAIIGCLFYLSKHKSLHPLCKYSLWLIIAGGVGNLIDRAIFGSVTDMFDFSIFPPVFNVADIAVSIGCVLLIIYVLFEGKIEKNNE